MNPGGLHHVDFVLKVTLQKRIVNIQLFDGPVPMYRNVKYKSYGCGFDDRAERFCVINTIALIVTFGD